MRGLRKKGFSWINRSSFLLPLLAMSHIFFHTETSIYVYFSLISVIIYWLGTLGSFPLGNYSCPCLFPVVLVSAFRSVKCSEVLWLAARKWGFLSSDSPLLLALVLTPLQKGQIITTPCCVLGETLSVVHRG